MTLMLFSGAWAKMIHEKNMKQKISWHCPFKGTQEWDFFWLRFWILNYFIVNYAQILSFCKATIGGDTIIPRSLRLSKIEFSLVWD